MGLEHLDQTGVGGEMNFLKRNIDVILAIVGAPLLTAFFAFALKSSSACASSAICTEYRVSLALLLGLCAAFVGSRIVYRAIHGIAPKG